jgi:transposase
MKKRAKATNPNPKKRERLLPRSKNAVRLRAKAADHFAASKRRVADRELARRWGISPTTVGRWRKDYELGGTNRLTSKKRLGRRPMESAVTITKVLAILHNSTPFDLGIDEVASIWRSHHVAVLFQRKCGKKPSVPTTTRWLRKFGFAHSPEYGWRKGAP